MSGGSRRMACFTMSYGGTETSPSPYLSSLLKVLLSSQQTPISSSKSLSSTMSASSKVVSTLPSYSSQRACSLLSLAYGPLNARLFDHHSSWAPYAFSLSSFYWQLQRLTLLGMLSGYILSSLALRSLPLFHCPWFLRNSQQRRS